MGQIEGNQRILHQGIYTVFETSLLEETTYPEQAGTTLSQESSASIVAQRAALLNEQPNVLRHDTPGSQNGVAWGDYLLEDEVSGTILATAARGAI